MTFAAARSSSVTPVVTSTTISTTSASARARSACSLTLASRASPAASQPPVSMIENGTPAQSAVSTLRSRVTPCSSSTTAARVPTIRLTSDDLPTLGRPATTTIGSVMPRTRAGRTSRRARAAATRRRTGTTSTGAGQVGQREAVEEAPLVEARVGQQAAPALGHRAQRPADVLPGEQPGHADVAAEELVRHRPHRHVGRGRAPPPAARARGRRRRPVSTVTGRSSVPAGAVGRRGAR